MTPPESAMTQDLTRTDGRDGTWLLVTLLMGLFIAIANVCCFIVGPRPATPASTQQSPGQRA